MKDREVYKTVKNTFGKYLYSKVISLHGHGGAWGERSYSSYSFSTSAVDGGE
jgi:hypothetical protein